MLTLWLVGYVLTIIAGIHSMRAVLQKQKSSTPVLTISITLILVFFIWPLTAGFELKKLYAGDDEDPEEDGDW